MKRSYLPRWRTAAGVCGGLGVAVWIACGLYGVPSLLDHSAQKAVSLAETPVSVPRVVAAPAGLFAAGERSYPSVAATLVLSGVMVGADGGGVALISVSGEAAAPVRVGAEVTRGLVLQSVGPEKAYLAASVGSPVLVTLMVNGVVGRQSSATESRAAGTLTRGEQDTTGSAVLVAQAVVPAAMSPAYAQVTPPVYAGPPPRSDVRYKVVGTSRR